MCDYIYLDDRIAIHQSLLEASGRGKLPVDGDVWLVDFPFYMDGVSKTRRAIFIDDEIYGLIAIRVSTIKPSTFIRDYNHVIENPRNCGFTKDVYAECSNIAQLSRVVLFKRVGALDYQNYQKVKNCLKKFIKERYLRVFNTMNWLLYLQLKDRESFDNEIQNEYDIENSRFANSIDISNVFHRISERGYIENHIVQTVVIDGLASTHDHWYSIFNQRPKGWRYVYYTPGVKAEGVISPECFKTKEDAINAYTRRFIIPRYGKDITLRHNVLGVKELRVWDYMAKRKAKQNEIINKLGMIPDNVKESCIVDIDDYLIANYIFG